MAERLMHVLVNLELKSNGQLNLKQHERCKHFVTPLSFCREKATVALYFGWYLARLGVADFHLSSKPPNRGTCRKLPYPRTQQRNETR